MCLRTLYIPQGGANTGKLLGIEGEDLYKALCKPKIKVGAEFVTQGRNVDQVSIGYLLPVRERTYKLSYTFEARGNIAVAEMHLKRFCH